MCVAGQISGTEISYIGQQDRILNTDADVARVAQYFDWIQYRWIPTDADPICVVFQLAEIWSNVECRVIEKGQPAVWVSHHPEPMEHLAGHQTPSGYCLWSKDPWMDRGQLDQI